MNAFAWLDQIIQAILQFVPRRVIIRATEGGVKWSMWREPSEMKPGFRMWWPLISDIEVIIVARQTLNLPTQSLCTKDGVTVVAGGVVVFNIDNVVQAIGALNWSPEDTCADIAQAAIVEVVSGWNYEDLLKNISGKVEEQITDKCRKSLRKFGVYIGRAALVDFSKVRQINHSGIVLQMTTA